jgi:hypothetical protein
MFDNKIDNILEAEDEGRNSIAEKGCLHDRSDKAI